MVQTMAMNMMFQPHNKTGIWSSGKRPSVMVQTVAMNMMFQPHNKTGTWSSG